MGKKKKIQEDETPTPVVGFVKKVILVTEATKMARPNKQRARRKCCGG
ncbi:MAG: hypothetical protein ACKOKF_12600 [Bacteroidota bacterium]